MDQLGGGIRFTVRVDRHLSLDGARFALRTVPAARRVARMTAGAAVLAATLAGVTTAGSMADGEALGPSLANAAPLWLFAGLIFGFGTVRFRAWTVVRQCMQDMPDESDATCRFDEAGYACSGHHSFVQYDWSAVTTVVEGDRFLALAIGRNRFISVPAERLTDIERATIRRWAEAARGGPAWEARRSSRENPRLQVSSSPAAD